MQVHVVNSQNRHLYLDEIEEMHRHRYKLFVEQMGWRALESADGLDIDEFDNANATYLIALEENGDVLGSGRVIPSWRPHMLKNLFPEYCVGEVPVGPGIWEWTRHAPGGRQFTRAQNLRAQFALNIAVIEFAVSRGIDAYTGILESKLIKFAADIGWRSEALGPARNYGEGMAVAYLNPIWDGQLAYLRERANLDRPVLVEIGGTLPAEFGRIQRRSVELALSLPPELLPRAVSSLAALADMKTNGE